MGVVTDPAILAQLNGTGAPSAGGPVLGPPPRPAPPPAPPTPFEVQNQGMRVQEHQQHTLEWTATHNPDGTPKPKAPQQQAYSQSALDAFDRAINSGERLKNHPGLGAAVGSGFDPQAIGSFNPITGKAFAGTNAANFNAELDAMKAQVFLPMVQSMKGMGALSNAEGQKLTDAIGALDPNMSEDAFKASLDRIIGDLRQYRDRGAGKQQGTDPNIASEYRRRVGAGEDAASIGAWLESIGHHAEPSNLQQVVEFRRSHPDFPLEQYQFHTQYVPPAAHAQPKPASDVDALMKKYGV